MSKLLLAIVACFLLVSCAAQKRQAEEAKEVAIECARAELEQGVNDVMPVLIAILNGDSVDWRKMVEGIAIQMGEDTVACALDKLAHPTEVAEVEKARAARKGEPASNRAAEYISEKGYNVRR